MDYLEIGPTPSEEDCIQVGTPDYTILAKKECIAFIRQLRRVFGEEPYGTLLKVKSFPHDFGTYLEVVCSYNENDQESADYAFRLEAECPAKWDTLAREELNVQ